MAELRSRETHLCQKPSMACSLCSGSMCEIVRSPFKVKTTCPFFKNVISFPFSNTIESFLPVSQMRELNSDERHLRDLSKVVQLVSGQILIKLKLSGPQLTELKLPFWTGTYQGQHGAWRRGEFLFGRREAQGCNTDTARPGGQVWGKRSVRGTPNVLLCKRIRKFSKSDGDTKRPWVSAWRNSHWPNLIKWSKIRIHEFWERRGRPHGLKDATRDGPWDMEIPSVTTVISWNDFQILKKEGKEYPETSLPTTRIVMRIYWKTYWITTKMQQKGWMVYYMVNCSSIFTQRHYGITFTLQNKSIW